MLLTVKIQKVELVLQVEEVLDEKLGLFLEIHGVTTGHEAHALE